MTPFANSPPKADHWRSRSLVIQEAAASPDVEAANRGGRAKLSFVQMKPLPEAETKEAANDASGGTATVALATGSQPKTSNPLRRSLDALLEVRSGSQSGLLWLEAASILKADAVRLRPSTLSRHSSVLLAIADALTFTEPDQASLQFSKETLDRCLQVLTSSFISEQTEESLLIDLLEHGWNLVPSGGSDPLAA